MTGLAARVAELETLVAEQGRRLDALTLRADPAAASRLLLTLAETTDGRPFTAAELLDRAAVDPALANVLDHAFIDGSKSCGRWLARLEAVTPSDSDLRLSRVQRSGVSVWRVGFVGLPGRNPRPGRIEL